MLKMTFSYGQFEGTVSYIMWYLCHLILLPV